MSVVAAVKEAIRCGSDHWMLRLPKKQMDAYYGGSAERCREEGSEAKEALVMGAAEYGLRTSRFRGGCHFHK